MAVERAAYLHAKAAEGRTAKMLQRRGRIILPIAWEMTKGPADQRFTVEELKALLSSWPGVSSASQKCYLPVAVDWLRWLGKLPPALTPQSSVPCPDKLDDFAKAQLEERGVAPRTVYNRRKDVRYFLTFLQNQGRRLEETTPECLDAYFKFLGQKWRRSSIKGAVASLRAWFRHCESRQWTRPRLAQAILSPRIYRFSTIPIGPTWAEVRRLIASTTGDSPKQLRDRAILILLAVYGLRSGELCRLLLEDIDWQKGKIRIIRWKTAKVDVLPLDPVVGNAIAQYLRHARPRCGSRALFMTMRSPPRPISGRRLHELLQEHCSAIDPKMKNWGPQALRHACAQHLLEKGHSFKQIGDHLGHRDPTTTQIYAKVDMDSLRLVAMEDLGGLA